MIFDMDGTMVDNMSYHAKSWLAFFRKRGTELDEAAFFAATAGRQNHEIFRTWLRPDLSDAECVQLALEKEGLYRELYAGQRKPVPGLVDFLHAARAEGLALAVGSAAPPDNLSFILDGMQLRPHFDAVVGAADVKRGKPEPDIFLLAAERLGVSPENCIVFEDAPLGVEAARRAGMRCIALTTTQGASAFADFPNVAACIGDFTSVTDRKPGSLFAL